MMAALETEHSYRKILVSRRARARSRLVMHQMLYCLCYFLYNGHIYLFIP
jgi:hypothetical protein